MILDKKDNFEKLKAIAGPINRLLEGELNITFFCENYYSKKNVTMDSEDKDKHDILDFYVINNGSLNKNETLTDFSQEFMAHLLNEFNLTDYLEKKYLNSSNENNNNKNNSNHMAEFKSFIQLTINLKNSNNNLSKSKIESIKQTKDQNNSYVENEKNNENNSIIRETENNRNPFEKQNETSGKQSKIILKKHNNLKHDFKKESFEDKNYLKKNEAKIPLKKYDSLNVEAKNQTINQKIIKIDKATIPLNKVEKKESENITLISSLKYSEDLNEIPKSSSFIENQSIFLSEPIENSKIIPLFKSNPYVLSFTQTKLNYNPLDYISSESLNLIEQSTNRLKKFIFASLLVLISTLLCFLLVKHSINLATKSMLELNSIKDYENKQILEEINQKHNLFK